MPLHILQAQESPQQPTIIWPKCYSLNHAKALYLLTEELLEKGSSPEMKKETRGLVTAGNQLTTQKSQPQDEVWKTNRVQVMASCHKTS